MNRIYSLKFFEDNPNCFVTGGWLEYLFFFKDYFFIGMIFFISGIKDNLKARI